MTADVPVVAGLRVSTALRTGRAGDLAMVAPAEPVAAGAGVAYPAQPSGSTGRLLLTASGRSATATVDTLDRRGRALATELVPVPADATRSWAIPVTAVGGTVRVTTTAAGRLIVARVVTRSAARSDALSVLVQPAPTLTSGRSALQRTLG